MTERSPADTTRDRLQVRPMERGPMTDSTPYTYTDDDGSKLTVDLSGGVSIDTFDGAVAGFDLPKHAAAALLLALDLGPGAVLRDIAPLLAQCDREDTSPLPESRYLHTREIRMLLGQPIPCGAIEPALGGARCGLRKHDEESWHVDPDKQLRWSYNAEGALDVRGWTTEDGRPVGGTGLYGSAR